ncbi:50S ribosomal subunit protein L25 [Candidatus Zinderia insecticola CARI]|uniref:50S ribosomal protein L25 n=1 Tax=Zinderia insecticola (strain CARI) TaxID=871271 RepID=E0TIN4_ZINIC|nr:50S ribosomal subunit protein L25 [Candidatus Zinderia insecticola CARI]
MKIHSFIRNKLGTYYNNKNRYKNRIPGVIYGNNKKNINLIFKKSELFKIFKKKNINILKIIFKKKIKKFLIKNIQFHAYKKEILHIDLLRISNKKKVNILIPLKFKNIKNSYAVKSENAFINFIYKKIPIFCLPKYIPKYILLNLKNLKVNNPILVKNINIKKNIKIKLNKNIIILNAYKINEKIIKEEIKEVDNNKNIKKNNIENNNKIKKNE